MASLADLPELVGFFSYSREDDMDSHGALSALRGRIQGELRGLLGRTSKTFRLWQDKEAIPSGKLWETEIKNAVGQAAFFIPIITPTVIASPYCRFELESFLAREVDLGRDDLVFPILYIDVPALENGERRNNDPVLSLVAKRQYVDWREFRYLDVNSTEVRRAVGRFCADIRNALDRLPGSLEERKQPERSATPASAGAERKRLDAEAERRSEEGAQQGRVEEHEQRREAEAEGSRIAVLAANAREKADILARRSEVSPSRIPSRLVIAAGSIMLVLIGVIGVWLARSSTPIAIKQPVSTPAAPSEPATTRPVAPSAPATTPVTPAAPVTTAPPSITQWPSPPIIATPPAEVAPAPVKAAPMPGVNAPLSPEQEQTLKAGDRFSECETCPKMMVVSAGRFIMGSPAGEPGSFSDERPQHRVAIAEPFAVGQFAVTFDEWDACAADGSCNSHRPDDRGWGRGRRPVIDVSWIDAKGYVAWLAQKTGKPYRLLTESEYEYATRAGTTTAYPWGSVVGVNNANCIDCGSQWDGRQTAPVGSFAPNGFGLFDMVGNVWQWTEDCYHGSYRGAPADGSAWITGECKYRVVRGGSWNGTPDCIRSANRYRCTVVNVGPTLGFRVARTLLDR